MTFNKFVTKYDRHQIDDWGSGPSPDFKQFAKDLRSVVSEFAKKNGGKLLNYGVGHYFVSGFINRGEKYCYFSYSVPRYGEIIRLSDKDPLRGFLVRTADGPEDYLGGYNSFCNFFGLEEMLEEKLK